MQLRPAGPKAAANSEGAGGLPDPSGHPASREAE